MSTPPPLVIKVGGSLDDPSRLLDDIAAQRRPVVLVHGAHRVLDDLAVRLGHPPRFITSATGAVSRYTDDAAMNHFLMAYCGVVNKRLVQALLARGVNAVGLAAMDGGMVRGRRRADIRGREGARTVVLHGDHAGTVTDVDTGLMRALLESGRTPVICPPALGDDGVPINVDGDRLAAELALALGAERMLIFSDTNGLLADPDRPESTVARAAAADLPGLAGAARGRARSKLTAVERALRGGVAAVGLCDGRPHRPLESALAGGGSWFTTDAPIAVR
ncbi:MAG TPA: [LysW]-aminoadipate kinase [Candidatus Dormibacteraeota bacterium]|nr:[LysW]-aminoadipate kinase [Candidatus Dormibacteraeota bacterium]